MKKDKLKELFEANELKKLGSIVGGLDDRSRETFDTNNAYTEGDIGSCDTDTSNVYDTPFSGGKGTYYSGDIWSTGP